MAPIESIVLYNTHNEQYHDRGAGPFEISGADSIQPWPPYPGSVDRYYPLDGDIADHSTNDIQATFYDVNSNSVPPAFSTDVPSALTGHTQSLSFSGAGEHLDFIDPPFSGRPTAYSISVWVNLHVVQQCNLIVRCTSLGGGYPAYAPQLRVNASGNFEFFATGIASDTRHRLNCYSARHMVSCGSHRAERSVRTSLR